MTHHESDGHGHIRKDFPGGWSGDGMNAFTGRNLDVVQRRAQDLNRTLINWRKNQSLVHDGKLMHYGPELGCYVYFRYEDEGEQAVMVVLNKNGSPIELPLERFHERLRGYTRAYDVIRATDLELGESLMLEPNEPYVLELRK